jgi:hypothetical protein
MATAMWPARRVGFLGVEKNFTTETQRGTEKNKQGVWGRVLMKVWMVGSVSRFERNFTMVRTDRDALDKQSV